MRIVAIFGFFCCRNLQKNMKIFLSFSVVDSAGKPPSGLETGNVVWAGNYDQCLEVKAPVINITMKIGPIRYTHQASFNSQYCLLSVIQANSPAVSPFYLFFWEVFFAEYFIILKLQY